MTDPDSTPDITDARCVGWQIERDARTPWRVGARCGHGRPTVIVSPGTLDDGSPFPTCVWLTCPHLAEVAFARESAGGTAAWSAALAADAQLARGLRDADAALRELRTAESGGHDACAAVGMGGQRDPLGVKCLHVHIAQALMGMCDPIGKAELGVTERECADDRCSAAGMYTVKAAREDLLP